MATVNELLITALSEIAPCYPWELEEADADARELHRIVFNYSTVPQDYADNLPVFECYILQVHYFCPYTDDSISVRKTIKKALFAAGFTYPDEIAVGTGSKQAAEEQHYCFECEYLEPIWDEDDEDTEET